MGSVRFDGGAEQPCSTSNNLLNFRKFIIFKAVGDAEAISQRAGERAGAGGGADDGEARQIETDATGGGAFTDDDVKFIIFRGRL